ncbi:YwiC-like family protein [Kineosporia sp. A_224]|uniref:YwiC-like family protein n=1 Tax=Kineosporia sp. A_224 TaxID=1962180 RepID=UPI000B4B76B2|nr:YwiC-like family protein [Kineosporia sp. A_224]
MTTAPVRPGPGPGDPRTPRTRRARAGRWVPPQHGAWAMLLLPFAAGLLPSWGGRPVWWHVPLLVAWLAAYLFSYFALLAVKTGRAGRVRPQLLAYGAVAVATGLPVVVARPAVLLVAPAFVALLAVNVVAARRRRDRALAAGLASVVQACLVTPVVVLVADRPVTQVLGAAAAVLLYLAGTVVHVKAMIRERRNDAYAQADVGYHLAALVPAVVLSAWLAVPFAVFVLRAALLTRRRTSVALVGAVEVGCSVLLLAALALPH